MKRIPTIIALAIAGFVASNASAQTNDHFARQRQEATAQHHFNDGHGSGAHYNVQNYSSGHWGGPTTNYRYYNPGSHYGAQQNIQYYPVSPFGYGFGYGVPNYGYGGGYPYYGGPYGAPVGTGVYIHREIYLGR